MKIQTAEKVLAKLVSMITVPTGRRSVAVVAEVHDLNRGTQSAPQFTAGEREANAAPDLLAALQALKAAPANDHAQQLAAWRMAHAAIAKAEGCE